MMYDDNTMAVRRLLASLYIITYICLLILSDVPLCFSNSTATTASPDQDRTPVYIGGFFSHGGTWDASGILPAVQMAIDHINERPDILPDYELRMVWNDTQVGYGCKSSQIYVDFRIHV